MPRTLVVCLAAVALIAGCKKDPPAPTVVPVSTVVDVPKTQPQAVEQLKRNFERVNFEFDSSVLTASAKRALAANAEILSAYPDIVVEVQGHCDERGTTEYNLALGQRRAAAVLDYLAVQGVPKARLSMVSYGEERPLASGAGETVWAQNRRAEFKIRAGQVSGVEGTTM